MANPITPERLAANGTEHGHQSALFCWAATFAPSELRDQLKLMFAIPNSGARGNRVAASHLKAEGVKAGVPDIMLPIAGKREVLNKMYMQTHNGLFIELKRPKSDGKAKGRVSADQNPYHIGLLQQGYAVHVCYGWQEARDCILTYLTGST
jgi:hypothetical protein